MTQRKLEALLAKWQPRLGLADWEIKIKLCSAVEMGGTSSAGTCEINLKRRLAVIKVLTVGDWPRSESMTEEEIDAEVEDTVIHECVHCHFAPFDPPDWDSPHGVAMEQAIDALSRAFVRTEHSRPQILKPKSVSTAKRKK